VHDCYEGFIVHAYPASSKTGTRLFLIGRLKGGKTFAVIETRERPAFYLRESDLGLREKEIDVNGGSFEESTLRTIDGERCVRVSWGSVQQFQEASQRFIEEGIRTYEGDIRFQDQFLMQRGIHGSVRIQGTPKNGRKVDLIFINPEITPSEWQPELSLLSLDIETDPRGTQIYAISLLCADPWKQDRREEVLFTGAIDHSGGIVSFSDERSLLQGFCHRIVEWDPDIITGWNVIDFDFKIIAERMQFHRLPFHIGRSDTPAAVLPGEKSRSYTVIVPGRQVLDAVRIVRASPEHFSDYSLQTVASSVLGRGKDLELLEDESRRDAVVRLYHQDPEALCRYCIEDARLVLDILEKTGLFDLTLRRCILIGISLERAWTSILAFEYLYIESLHRKGFVAPSLGVDPFPTVDAPGGAILQPQTGIYDNVWVFDFRSLYPSIIRTFNIDPLSFVLPKNSERLPKGEFDRLIVAPNDARFRREAAILPELLKRFFQNRDEAKKTGDEVASYVYKIIMNSFYGVLGAAGSRFASGYISGAITSFGQYLLRWCSDYFSRLGYRVIYGDTDSLFVLSGLKRKTSAEELMEKAEKLCTQINSDLSRFIDESYKVKSYLTLEFEKVYHRFFLPPVRGAVLQEGGRRGRAKGYAGLLVPVHTFIHSIKPEELFGYIEVKGMEAVRRDWTELARGFQIGLLALLFRGAEVKSIREFIYKLVVNLLRGGLDGQLVYMKALRKPVSDYTRTKPPHVRAASMLAQEDQHGLIHYLWTTEGPQPVGKVTAPIDYEHYVEKQLKPIAHSFTEVLGIDLETLFGSEEQLSLF